VRRVTIFYISLSASLLLPAAQAAGPAETYKEKCALCHDAGATGAPRLGLPRDWTQRVQKGYAGLLRSALQGMPGTAMLPKAGFPELTESEIAGVVRYMLASVNLPPDLAPGEAAELAPQRSPASFEARVDDATLALSVVQALLGAKVGGVQVEARNGRVVLKGVVDDAAAAARAKRAAQGVAGVREIEDRLVSADVFEHD
jgi:cytochrome c5